jgi:hypothetical protein
VTSKLHRLPILATAAALLLAACSSSSDAEPPTTPATTSTTAPPTTAAPTTTTTSTTSTTTTTTIAETTTTEAPAILMPLTGVELADASQIPPRPALVVKIDNHPKARPQAGLNEADIVFEENVEGITRFAAVFHSQGSDPVGPIRSGRTQDVDMLSPLRQPLFAWSGGNPGVRRVISDSDFVNLDAGFSPGYYRRSGRGGAPHNLFSSTDALWANTPETFSVPTPIFPYVESAEQITGEPAAVVNVKMRGLDVRWEWDAEAGVYRRFHGGNPHETELTGQVTTDNVVVMAVDYQPSAVDRNSPEAQTIGTGPVIVFSNGVARRGIWIHLNREDPYGLLVEADQSSIGLEPGRTFVELAEDAENFATWE